MKTIKTKKAAKKPVAKKKPTKNYTHIVAVLDRSGSMSSVQKDAIGGFNTFLETQNKLKEKATMSVVLFDDKYEPLYDGKDVDLSEVKELTTSTFVPRGSTALYDAIGKSIHNYMATYDKAKKSDRPDKVLVIIVTDGEENSSKEYDSTKVNELITDRKKNNWQFMFLCATEDAFKTGAKLGVSAGNTFQFANTGHGNQVMYAKMSSATAMYRSTPTSSASFKVTADNLLNDEDDTK